MAQLTPVCNGQMWRDCDAVPLYKERVLKMQQILITGESQIININNKSVRGIKDNDCMYVVVCDLVTQGLIVNNYSKLETYKK